LAGPNGLAQEIYTTARTAPLSLDIPVSGFVTGTGGMGHLAITTKKPHQVRGYYNHVFDARLPDYIDETINSMKLKIRFLRVNEVTVCCPTGHKPEGQTVIDKLNQFAVAALLAS
jgi:hypothetical protein